MQHDNYNNHQIDQQLRELEQYSLPDLSKQDDHWKSMAGLLITAQPAHSSKGLSKTTWKWIIGIGTVAILAAILLTVKLNTNKEHHGEYKDAAHTLPIVEDTIKRNKDTAVASIADSASGPIIAMPTARNTERADNAVVDALYDRMEKKAQYFTISNNRDTVLYGNEGSVLSIPGGSFDTQGDVTIMLQEFYTIKDMIGNLLYTKTSDGKQLVTGGMMYIEAIKPVDAYVPVNLRKGASIRLDMPKRDNQTMNLFYGRVHDSNEMPDITWDRTDEVFKKKTVAADTKKTALSTIPNTRKERPGIVETIAVPSPDYPIIKDTPVSRNATAQKKIQGDSIGVVLNIDTSASRIRSGTVRVANTDIIMQIDTINVLPDRSMRNSNSIVNEKVEEDLRNQYGVDLRSLGWINCDRFFNNPGPMINFYVEVDKPAAISYTYLVFERFQSILPAQMIAGSSIIIFPNVPANEKVKIICVGAEKGKLLTVVKDATTTGNPLKLALTENTAAGFERSIAGKSGVK
ncbi:MAG TPA: hypothetical protein VHM26_01015 [Chitinophagaceae bacterium]|nr:hypothetical protein [Chitinophagaceae bacterium]